MTDIFFLSLPVILAPTWGEWEQWGDCTVACGGGTRTRVKSCNDADTSDTETCEGDTPTETGSCNNVNCRKLQNYYNLILLVFFICGFGL